METTTILCISRFLTITKNNTYNRLSTKNSFDYIYEDTQYDKSIINSGNSCDVKYDKCIVHFTSRNYFGNYDSLIFQAYVYMNNNIIQIRYRDRMIVKTGDHSRVILQNVD